VQRLQARIVKATQEERWGKVKALQHLLTHSFSGRALAVKRVTENAGKRTSGVDRRLWDTPESKMTAVSTGSAQTSLYPEKQWQIAPSRYSDHERSSDAGTLPIGAGSHRGNYGRS
jgi:hypothetical protein